MRLEGRGGQVLQDMVEILLLLLLLLHSQPRYSQLQREEGVQRIRRTGQEEEEVLLQVEVQAL